MTTYKVITEETHTFTRTYLVEADSFEEVQELFEYQEIHEEEAIIEEFGGRDVSPKSFAIEERPNPVRTYNIKAKEHELFTCFYEVKARSKDEAIEKLSYHEPLGDESHGRFQLEILSVEED